MTEPMKTYEVKRTVIEYYYVNAKSKKEAMDVIDNDGDPVKIVIKSQTAKVKL